jgi:hypothetical protein
MSHNLLRTAALALLTASTMSAGATSQRTFVASNGSDANPCTLAQPCRGFAAAVANTNAGGEVVVLDSAGYGPATITKSITIVAPRGVYAGVSVFSGDGITIDGSMIDVTLRGLSINGQGGANGVNFVQGSTLAIEECEVAGMNASGIVVQATNGRVAVRNSVLRHNNDNGLIAIGAISATLDNVNVFSNFAGVQATPGSRVMVAGTTLASNGTGVWSTSAGGGDAQLFVTRSTLSDNGTGMFVQAPGGSSASIVSDGNAIGFDSFAALRFAGGAGSEVIYTTGNNAVGYYNTGIMGGSLTPLNPL